MVRVLKNRFLRLNIVAEYPGRSNFNPIRLYMLYSNSVPLLSIIAKILKYSFVLFRDY